MTLGKRLRQYRDERGYSRETAAHMLNVSFSALEKWETGKRRPTLEKAQRLAQLYGVDVSILVGDSLTKKGEKAELVDLALQYKDVLLSLEAMDGKMKKTVIERLHAISGYFPKEDAEGPNFPSASLPQVKKSS